MKGKRKTYFYVSLKFLSVIKPVSCTGVFLPVLLCHFVVKILSDSYSIYVHHTLSGRGAHICLVYY